MTQEVNPTLGLEPTFALARLAQDPCDEAELDRLMAEFGLTPCANAMQWLRSIGYEIPNQAGVYSLTEDDRVRQEVTLEWIAMHAAEEMRTATRLYAMKMAALAEREGTQKGIPESGYLEVPEEIMLPCDHEEDRA